MCVGTNTCQLKANKHKSKNAWNRFVRSWDSETRQHIWTMLIYDFYVMHVYKRCWHEECRQHSTFNQTCVTQLVFAVQPFESFEALLMPVLWHHDCINLDAHTIPLAKTVGRSVCYSVARKSGHVGKIFTSKKTRSIITFITWSLFGFQEIIFLLAPLSCCMMWKYGTCSFPHLGRFWIRDLFGLGGRRRTQGMLADYGLVLRCPPKNGSSWRSCGIPL